MNGINRKTLLKITLVLTTLLFFLFSSEKVYSQQPLTGFPYTDSFKNPTSPGTIFGGANRTSDGATPTLGSAFLTASQTQVTNFGSLGLGGTNLTVAEESGGGYLRLTRNSQNQVGFARNTRTFPTSDGLSITFEYYTHGGIADGIVFFLYDADVVNRSPASNTALGYTNGLGGFQIGAHGGSLGYAQRTDNGIAGLSKGFLGIGIDEFGNFGTTNQGRSGGYGGNSARTANWVTLRGDGDGVGNIQPGTVTANSNYEYLIGVNTASSTAVAANGATSTVVMGGPAFNIAGGANPSSRTAGFTTADVEYRKARIDIKYNSSTNFTINVYIRAGSVERHVIQNYTYVPTEAAPANLSYGFSAGTGGAVNYHEIRAIDIRVPSDVLKVPIATTATTSTLEDTPILVDLTTFAYDQNGNDQLNWATGLDLDPTIVGAQASRTIPGQGTFIANASGTVTFTPVANYNGIVSTDYTIADFGNASPTIPVATSNAASLTITVTPVNDAPTTASKTVTTNEDVPYVFTAADFTVTDAFDNPQNTLSAVQITTLPASGTLLLAGVPVVQGASITLASINAASFTYSPPSNASASPMTSFNFRVQDNGGTANGGVDLSVAAASMTINVLPANDPPAGIDKTISTNEDVPYTFQVSDFGFTDAFDISSNGLLSLIVSPPGTGSLTVSGVPVTSSTTISAASITSLVYTPPLNASASPTTFTFQVRDDGGTANGGVDLDPSPNTITINVVGINDAPSGTDKTIATNEDLAYTFVAADFGFTDAFDTPPNNFQSLIVSPVTAGSLTINGVPVSVSTTISAASVTAGSLVYTPVANTNGSPVTSFTFQVRDDGGTANGGVDLDPTPNTISINVTSVNDAPSGTDKTVTTNEDVAYVFTATDFGFSDAFDTPPNNFLSVIASPVAAGSLTLDGVPVSVSTTINAASVTAGLLVYTPASNANGSPVTSFTFQVKDDGGTALGGLDTDQSPNTISINVTAVNDLPVVADIPKAGAEDATITFTALDFTSKFTDVEGDALTKIKVINLPANGLLKLNGVDITAGQEILLADLPNFTFVPTTNFNGSTTFKWNGFDGTAYAAVDEDVNITITPVNDLPVVADIPKTGLEDAILTFTALDFTSKFTDADGNTLTKINIINLPANGLLKLNGTNIIAGAEILLADLPNITFVPITDFNGSTTFKWNGFDGTAYAAIDEDVNITITALNDAPSFIKGANQAILTTAGAQTVTAWATSLSKGPADEAAQTLAFTVTNANNALFTVQPAISSAGVLTYTPSGTAGTATVTVVLKDNGGTANGGVDTYTTQTFTITITAPAAGNNPPVVDVIPKVGTKDSPVPFTVADFTSKFTDADSNPLSKIRIVTLPPSGTLKLNGVDITVNQEIPLADLANISFVPATGFTGGPVTFQWNGSDGTDYAVTPKDVNITIYATNAPPVAVADAYSTVKGGTLTVAVPGVLSNDSDADANLISAIKVTDPSHGTLTLNPNGSFTYVHNNGTSTSDSFTYKLNDGIVDGNTVTVTITINATNTPPVIVDIPKTGIIDQPVTFTSGDFTSKFTDSNGDALNKIRIVTLPPSGTLRLNGLPITLGQEIPLAELPNITFIPPAGFSGGPISFQWNGSDGTDYAAVPKNVNITIDPTSITISVTEVCIGDVPWVQYTITGLGFTPAANSATIRWKKMDGTIVRELTNQALTGQLLWPGAAVDANGIPTAWPGWSFTGGQWVQISDGLRPQMRLHISINPETEVVVNYPPATPFCSANPNRPPVVTNIAKSSTGFLPIPFTVNDFTSKYTDPDGDPLVKIKIVTLPANGTLKLNGVPVTANQEIPVASLSGLTFEPALNWSGTTNFTWNGSDGDTYALANANAAITVIALTDPNAKIGLAKNLASVTPALNGTYDVKFIFTAVNFGPNGLDNVSIRDNLALAFGGTQVVVKSLTAFGGLKANTAFNGIGTTELLLPTSSLTSGEEAKVELLINVKLTTNVSTTFQNTAIAEAVSAITGLKVTDVSTNGLKPDPNVAGDVSSSLVTPIQLDAFPTYVPQGFSPNGDGMNDKFVIQNANGKRVSLEIYNRWGNRVYKSDDYRNDWGGEVTEGFFLGRDIPDGTYYYIIIIDNKDKYAGFITINR